MSQNMETDIFAEQQYGQLALKKLAPVADNFRLFSAGWLGQKPEDWKVMKVTGAEFRVAKAGPNKGKLSIMVAGTQRSTHVTREEIDVAMASAEQQTQEA